MQIGYVFEIGEAKYSDLIEFEPHQLEKAGQDLLRTFTKLIVEHTSVQKAVQKAEPESD